MLLDLLYVSYDGGGEFVKAPYGRVMVGDKVRTDFGIGTVTDKMNLCPDNQLLLFLDKNGAITKKLELVLEVDDDLSKE